MDSSGKLEQRPAWTRERISAALGESLVRLIATIAKHAHAENAAIYLAGGVVRDLVLQRENTDLDFVLEGDAIAFANKLARIYGGETERHIPFGTAKWKLDSAAINNLSLGSGAIPAQIDFATARTEEYLAPAALPVVEPGLIAQDLLRRDFTVNALALRIEAESCPWDMLNPGKGYSDILGKKIRVLHDRSFIDDPTRMFRAFRFASRFGFAIESGTAEILREAIPVIQRLSGERIRHELDLILREEHPERIIADLSALDIFAQIHAAFRISARSAEQFQRLREHMPKLRGNADETARLGWHLLFSGIAEDDALLICARLGLTGELSSSIAGFARLLEKLGWLGAPASKASAITRFLDGISATALRAALICNIDKHSAKERLELYLADWRHRRSAIDGNELIRAGLAPGPIYREILDKLRDAWIDGEIESQDQEHELFLKLVKEAQAWYRG
ncbi:MAG: hypothetical protein OXT68_15580 [Chloroflexota bacterium]|nr:hypothetical protein [Chloroflexota bacterium]